MSAFESAEARFRRLAGELDFRLPTRAEWRAIGYGTDRRALQSLLLELAEGARIGTVADRLSLYQAAYAVLPFQGGARVELARLLLTFPPVALEWCDILLETLTEEARPDSLSEGVLLEGLRAAVEHAEQNAVEPRHLRHLLNQILLLGYQPDWLLQWLPETVTLDVY